MYSFLNTEFLPAEKTFVHVSDLAVQRGYGIFDFLKAVNGKIPFIDDYFDQTSALTAFERARDQTLKKGFHLMFAQGVDAPN